MINIKHSALTAQMESTLAEFTDTHTTISKQIYITYNTHVTNLSRRFFHLLLRYSSIFFSYYYYNALILSKIITLLCIISKVQAILALYVPVLNRAFFREDTVYNILYCMCVMFFYYKDFYTKCNLKPFSDTMNCRYKRLDKAFELAKSIEAKDLFMVRNYRTRVQL